MSRAPPSRPRPALPLAQILATRQVTPQIRQTRKYRAIRSSIEAVGVVEALVVHPQPGGGYCSSTATCASTC